MNSGILPFRAPELSDAAAVRRCTQNALQSDLSFANIYLLRHKYGTRLLFHMEHLIRHFSGHVRLQGYSFPVGGKAEELEACLRGIEAHSKATGTPLHYCLLTREQVEFLREIYGNKAEVRCDEGDADYLYNRELLANLPGTAYHKKRTHVSKFLRQYPDAKLVELTDENAADALLVAKQWLAGQEESPALQHEYKAMEHALENREILGIGGGIVYVDGEPISMALVSQINSTVTDIHYEKCIPEFRDAYSYINRELAAVLNTEWINREEDLNIPGLRKAKLSYHPSLILKKYNATIYVD